ncbi:hypothetical protein DF147_03460 [Burkholderia cenocepacia]|nr:hypothetical protein DF147_03460 [Burkholderia cenocepacia]RQU94006.1 hypothetical protein DF133_05990 [Burkholderia cenocepacia]RQV56231.1 hypothetical protein DF024_29610 [Burkholderia cenocepacia]RQV91313.1 hypothetical protein DF019_03480 [Burkholderia cenocepacia]
MQSADRRFGARSGPVQRIVGDARCPASARAATIGRRVYQYKLSSYSGIRSTCLIVRSLPRFRFHFAVSA